MGKNHRQILIATVTFLSGLYFFLEFVLPEKVGGFKIGVYHDSISLAFVTVGAMAIGLGVINIMLVHGRAVVKTTRGWGNSLALIIGLAVMLLVEGGDFINAQLSVSKWQEIDNLALFSQKIRQDSILKDQKAELRLEALSETAKKISSAPWVRPGNTQEHVAGRQILEQDFSAALRQVQDHSSQLIDLYRRQQFSAEQRRGRDFELFEELALELDIGKKHSELEETIYQAATAGRIFAEFDYKRGGLQQTMNLLRRGFFYPLGSAMFSLLAFYIATAAYRSFRIRSLEAFIMMAAAVAVVLGQMPHGPQYISPKLPAIRLWLLENISTPAFRAIYFGATIAGLAMAIRMWLSLEKSPLAVDDD